MKKVIIMALVVLATMTSLFAKDDPFATKRFTSKDMEINFRFQDEKGVPLVQVKDKENTFHFYYNFDSENLAFYYSDGSCAELYQYSFIKDGKAIRLFSEDGSFKDLDSDNGKSTADIILETTDKVIQKVLFYGGTGALVGFPFGSYGSAIGLLIGGSVGIGKSLLEDVFDVF